MGTKSHATIYLYAKIQQMYVKRRLFLLKNDRVVFFLLKLELQLRKTIGEIPR